MQFHSFSFLFQTCSRYKEEELQRPKRLRRIRGANHSARHLREDADVVVADAAEVADPARKDSNPRNSKEVHPVRRGP